MDMTIASAGKFVWFDYVAPDTAKAAGFYGELFNWKTREIPFGGGVNYTMLSVGDDGIGGILKTPPGAPEMGHWLGHLSVEDIDASVKQITSLGGKVLRAPAKQGEFGTMAIVADPLEGAFVLWQPTKPQSNGDFKGEPNYWVWNELYTQEPEKSVEFYSKIGGYTEDKMMMKEGAYHILNRDGKGRAGVMKPPMPMPQAWMPYVQVAHVDQTIAKATQLGANVHVAGEDIPGIGRIGIFSDPQGGMLGVLQPAPAQ
jgi:predicted enzyme related to lactoylglutathione lyase